MTARVISAFCPQCSVNLALVESDMHCPGYPSCPWVRCGACGALVDTYKPGRWMPGLGLS